MVAQLKNHWTVHFGSHEGLMTSHTGLCKQGPQLDMVKQQGLRVGFLTS